MLSRKELSGKFSSDLQTGDIDFENKSLVYHCDYSQIYWQKYIERASAVDGKQILSNAMRDHFSENLNKLFEDLNLETNSERAEAAEDYFSIVTAFGNAQIPENFREGQRIVVENSHIGKAWKKIFDGADEPKCTWWEGMLEAAAGSITGPEGPSKEKFDVKETKCIAEGAEHCEFEVNKK